MPAGRPSTYTPEILDKAKYYLDHYEDEEDVIPSVAGLSVYLNERRDQLYKWANQEDKKEFSNILEAIVRKQEKVLLAKGLSGTFNSHITKLVLGKHGYHDRKEVSGPDGSPVEFLASISPTIGPPQAREENAQEDATAGSEGESD